MAEKTSHVQSSSGGTAAESQGPKLRASKPEEVPGEKPAMLSTRILEGTAATLQSFKPINNFTQVGNPRADGYCQRPE